MEYKYWGDREHYMKLNELETEIIKDFEKEITKINQEIKVKLENEIRVRF